MSMYPKRSRKSTSPDNLFQNYFGWRDLQGMTLAEELDEIRRRTRNKPQHVWDPRRIKQPKKKGAPSSQSIVAPPKN